MWVRRFGALAVVVEPRDQTVDVALVLDDRSASLDDGHADAWREWLRMSNALALRDWPTEITTTSLVSVAPVDAGVQSDASAALAGLDSDWVLAYEAAEPGAERDLMLALAGRVGARAPVVGAEGPDGIPLDISWPVLNIVVDVRHMSSKDRDDLESAGWRVLSAEPDSIALAVTGPAGADRVAKWRRPDADTHHDFLAEQARRVCPRENDDVPGEALRERHDVWPTHRADQRIGRSTRTNRPSGPILARRPIPPRR